jgi:hypothetical protein
MRPADAPLPGVTAWPGDGDPVKTSPDADADVAADRARQFDRGDNP